MSICYINFSYFKTHFDSILTDVSGKDIIIDLAGSVSHEHSCKVFNPRNWDNENKLEIESQKTYVNTVGKTSLAFRNFLFMGFPVFWATAWSVKHPILHFGAILYYFKALLENDKMFVSLINEHEIVKILLPKTCSKHIEELISIWIKRNKLDCRLVFLRSSKRKPFIYRLFRNWSSLFIHFTRMKTSFLLSEKTLINKTDYCEEGEIVFIAECPNLAQHITFREFIGEADLKYRELYFPDSFGSNVAQVIDWDRNELQATLKYSTPSFKEIFSVFFISIWLRKKLMGLVNSNNICQEDELLKKHIAQEISHQLTDFVYIMKFFWLKTFFVSSGTNGKYIYTDEFYRSGRLISQAAKNSNNKGVTTVGYQHALIGRHHTVYNLGNLELNGVNSIPIPDKFLVWGEYYKKFFLSNNDLDDNYLSILSPPKYRVKFRSDNGNSANKKVTNVLWCTTLLESALVEFEYMKNMIGLDQYNFSIRCHPIHNIAHLIKVELSDQDKKTYNQIEQSDVQDLFYAIKSADIVVCSNPSTIFMDSLYCKKPVIVIDTKKLISCIKAEEVSGLFVISSGDEFEKALDNCKYLIINKEKVDAGLFIEDSPNTVMDVLNTI